MPTSPYGSEVRLLLRSALLLFTFTVVVGILNGVDLVEFDRKFLLTHVHAGTLGWITISVVAATLWLFALGDPAPQGRSLPSMLALFTAVAIAGYAVAFLTTFGVLRPIVGGFTLFAILGAWVWALRQTPGRTLSVPHVGILAALTMSVVGAVLGVLLGYRISNGSELVPATAAEAHPAAMVVGFLVPVGMAFIEWVLDPASVTRRATLAGWLQIGLPFTGGVTAMVGLLLSIPPLITLGLPFEFIGLGILVYRLRGPLAAALNPMVVGPRRYGPVALVFLFVNIGILTYLVVNYFSQELPPPLHVLLAMDHAIFIGVMTNCIFAVVMLFRREVTPMVDQVVFYGLNLGLIAFLAGLLLDSSPLKHAGTPVLGIALLVGIAGNFMALGGGVEAPAERETAMR
ncbi:MAG: hypothetical protein AB7G21_05790 [Dehalococcoidia bacterium]